MKPAAQVKLRLGLNDYRSLQTHLFPGDDKEAVAVALCGRRHGDTGHCLMVQKLVPIPYADCKSRTPAEIVWSTEKLIPLLHQAAARDLAILKIHSHPNGFEDFSETDNAADKDLFNSVFGWTDSEFPHASAVMLPDGRMFGRTILPDGSFRPLDSILVPGHDLLIWHSRDYGVAPSHAQRHIQLFGTATFNRMRGLSVAVVGCSGTGSPLVEQLARLGVARLVLIDPDFIEDKNLNRILNAARLDAYLKRSKVEVAGRSITRMGLGTDVEIISANLATPAAVRAVAECDLVFGCMDGAEGRHLLNRLAAFYLLPYFDVGVKLVADGRGGIDEACGAVHYVQPEGDTLIDRGVYTWEDLKAEGLRRTDPIAYREQVRAGYIHGAAEDRPAVISINMQMASMAINEFLARLHPYRHDPNDETAILRMSFIQGVQYREKEGKSSGIFSRHLGKGDVRPLLLMPELSDSGARA